MRTSRPPRARPPIVVSKWTGTTLWTDEINKKGRDPRQGRPFENRAYGIVKPSREGLPALPE